MTSSNTNNVTDINEFRNGHPKPSETEPGKNRVRTAVRIGTATLAIVGAGFGGVKLAEAMHGHNTESFTTDKHVSYTVEQTGVDSTVYGIAEEAYPDVHDVQDAVKGIEAVNNNVNFDTLQAGQNLKMPDMVDDVNVVPQFDDSKH